MESNEYGLSLNIEGVGYLDTRHEGKDLHAVKSLAGKAFHVPEVKSVCVYGNTGIAHLYLKKTPEGVIREERD